MKLKKTVILYFINGHVPSAEQLEEGQAVGAKFRNANLVGPPRFDKDGNPALEEHADYVMGDVPEAYEDVPRFGDKDEHEEIEDPTAGEQVGNYYLHMISRGNWLVVDEEGERLNDEPLTKADARTLALENTEED
jgi:hypothetical protein